MELMSLQQMSISGAVLILAIAVLRAAFLNKLPKKTFLALWEIAVLRLLLPFSIPSPFSVYSWIGRNMSSIPADTDGGTVEAIHTAVLAAPQTINSGSTEDITNRISVWLILWCAGMILCAAFFAVTYLRCLSEFRMSLPVKNDGGFAKEWLNRHPLNRSVTIRQSDRITVPLTYGVFHPVILVPKTMDWREKEQVNCVLLHEYTHIRRYDAVTKLLLILTMCIHWFNPMVWLMVHLANRDLELSCDECVVRKMGEASKAAYARTLIQMEERKSGFAPLMNHFSKNIIEERILAIMKIKKYSKKFSAALALTAVVLVGSVTLVFATSSVKDAPSEETAYKDVVVMESEDGTVSYSVENGTTWVVEDDGTVQSPVIEWWTYDEFKEWMEEEIRFLESIADDGDPDYYDDDNVLRDYTKKDVEETASTYQSMLESIKNGMKISKSVDGTDDLCVAMYENSGDVSYTVQENVSTVVNEDDMLEMTTSDAYVMTSYIEDDKAETDSAYSVVFHTENGVVEVGPFESKEELLEVLKPYCDKLVASGELTESEAQAILEKYQ